MRGLGLGLLVGAVAWLAGSAGAQERGASSEAPAKPAEQRSRFIDPEDGHSST
jgi:hypothetical protein